MSIAWRWFLAGVIADTVAGAIMAASIEEPALWGYVVGFALLLLVLGRWRLQAGVVTLLVLAGVGAISSVVPPYEWWRVLSLPFDVAAVACAVAARRRLAAVSPEPASRAPG